MNELIVLYASHKDTIEALVMKTINEGFAHQFQNWFNLLVDSPDIMVELDECFAPLNIIIGIRWKSIR